MTDLESRFHAEWLGLVQPVEGLVVSVPVLADAQCMRRQSLSRQQRLAELAPASRIADLTAFLAELLDWTPDLYDAAPALPDDLSLYVPEGHQTLRPTLALRHLAAPDAATTATTDDSTPASRAGSAYVALLWDLPPGLPLDKPETATGPWEYPPAAKFDRLLRACRVPVGVLTNRDELRLVYAPHGESSGHITFRVEDMASVAGRSIFDAFVMLLSTERFFGVAPEHQLPRLLRDSRTRQANVTNELAEQMLDALHVLLAGFVAAAERDGSALLEDALARDDDHVYKGLLTVLLRLVFVLYAEDRALLPVEHPDYAEHLSALGLFEQLQRDHGEWPDSMARRFGAWPRLVALFRAVFLGMRHGDLVMPARRGELFDPHRFAFLEGWGPAGSAPLVDHDAMARVRVPTVDDETVFRVLQRLLVFQGQRLSYRALDVEQIGAVYEALMGYHVVRLAGPSVCLKGAKVWVTASELLAQPPAQRAAWVADTAALPKSAAAKLGDALKAAATEAEALAALDALRVKGSATGRAGQLVIQPGSERRRTSSHYTPPSLTAPIVRRTLEPLLAAMGPEPSSERLLDLKVCDPAMGSGAFLVEACRYLADVVVAAWTREGKLGTSPPDPLSMNGEGEAAEEEEDVESEGVDLARRVRNESVAGVTGGSPHVDPIKLERARALRRAPTPATRAAWQALRGRKMLGLKFRREQVIDGFIADFYCPSLGLVIEVDGGVHDEPASREYDAVRSQWFDALGIQVARIRNDDVSAEALEGLITPFLPAPPPLHTAPPSPSPFMERGPGGEVDPVLHARRLVAQRCLYGVDKNPLAVSLARLSLWLVTLAKDEPFTFVDHALRHGDSLVGLDVEQIRSFHWKPGAQLEFARELIDTALVEALEARQRILALAAQDDTRAKEHLLWDANDALAPVRLIGDLVVGAFFAHDKDKAREAERKRRLDLVVKWLESRREPPDELLAMQRQLRERVPAFHWWVEFPEVFYGGREDPLDGGKVNDKAWMDAFVGNPPFAGKNGITESGGPGYLEWLLENYEGAHGNADLSAYFFRRAFALLGDHGSAGMIATNTIAQGDTRTTGLLAIIHRGAEIYDAISSMPWPGEAGVSVAVVHAAKGGISAGIGSVRLNGSQVRLVNSRLREGRDVNDPAPLKTMKTLHFSGCKVYGEGFVIDQSERGSLLMNDPKNSDLIFSYIGGEDLNRLPNQSSNWFVINVEQRSLEEVESYPAILKRIRHLVKPERDRARDDTADGAHRKKYWWQFAQPRPEMFHAIKSLRRFLATARVTKHLCFSFLDVGVVPNEKVFVFPFEASSSFSVLQSRIHVSWAWRLSSTLEDRLNFSASDCFETFPFPQPDPRTVIPALEDIGERLYTTRAKFMVNTQQGLTQTYNALKDPRVTDSRVVELRRLHEEMDRAVLAAYGWDDLAVPPYGTPTTDVEKKAQERFEDEVIDRLFALNAKRAEEEREATAREEAAKPAKAKGGRKKKVDDGQGNLGN
jgi:very-short-patch-repair endonuclease